MILIGLGANLPSKVGTPLQTLQSVVSEMERRGFTIVALSSFSAFPAWPNVDEPPFINGVAWVEASLSPTELLRILQELEREYGRLPGERYAPRPLDLDILAYDDVVMDRKGLTLPHPSIQNRLFVLQPLVEIAPHWRHPVSQLSASEMLDDLRDRDEAETLAA